VKYVLDTDTCVYWLRGRQSVRDHLANANPDDVAISIVTLAELRYGAAYSARPEDNNRAVDDFASGISVISLTVEAARSFGDIKAELRRGGVLLEDLDLLIAATARAHGLTLVTNNLRHFGRVTGVALEDWGHG
jgi:tRNA(fMet)-specific endonuclease VapC